MRLPCAIGLDSRDGVENADSRMVNTLAEQDEGTTLAAVRPALKLIYDTTGNGNGLVVFNEELISVYGATLGFLTLSAVIRDIATLSDRFYDFTQSTQ